MSEDPGPYADYLLPTEVGRLLCLSRARVRELTEQGRLPHVMTPYGRLYEPGPVLALARTDRPAGRRLADQTRVEDLTSDLIDREL